MKLLLLPLLLAGVGAGWYGMAPLAPGGAAPACEADDCRVTVECTGRGTCIVTCTDANGEVRCQAEVSCDGPCESRAQTAGEACAPGPACQR